MKKVKLPVHPRSKKNECKKDSKNQNEKSSAEDDK